MKSTRFVLLVAFALSLSAAACTPATTYNRGLDISYHPSANADGDERLMPSAIELKSADDERTIRSAGGRYIGELEVSGLRSGASNTGAGSGAGTLAGRISLEAATRGATHFYAVSSDIVYSRRAGIVPTSKTDVRFVLYRVERDGWNGLPAPLRPEGAPSSPVASR